MLRQHAIGPCPDALHGCATIQWNRSGFVCVKLGMDIDSNIAAHVDFADPAQSWVAELVVRLLLKDFALSESGRAVIRQYGTGSNPLVPR